MRNVQWPGRAFLVFLVLSSSTTALAQTAADYDRALGLRQRYEQLVTDVVDSATWIRME
jgi:hypothetical protein